MLRALAAVFALLTLLAAVPLPARAASVLSNGSVTPTSGTTATSFAFSVDYLSDDSPRRPAQVVWAEAGGTTVTLTKVSGASHDGTWQGSASLPAGTWQVTFHATTSNDPQPAPLTGPIITVTPAPTPAPTPTPSPTPTPRPPAPTPPTGPPPPPPGPTNRPPQPLPSDPTSSPSDDEPDQTRSPSPSRSPTPTASAAERSRSPGPSATGELDPGAPTPVPTEPPIDDAGERSGGMLASFLIVGGTMSLAGAAVLARQWVITRGHRPH